jgi:site-specific DNA recombinase
MKKAVAYIRVSSTSQEDNTSLENQLNKISLTCQLEDLELVKVYRDVCSGKDIKKRPGLNQMLNDIDTYDTVVVFKIDRLARRLLNAVTIGDKLINNNKNLVSVTEKIDLSTAIGRMLFNMLSSFAEYERELICERVQSGKKATKEKGGFTGGQLRLGFTTEKQNNISVIVPDETEQEIIKIVKNHKRSGKGLTEIATWLNDNGFKTRQNKLFTATQIKRVLENDKSKKITA